MSSARRVAELDAWTKAGQWQATVGPQLFGSDVHGKTLGIVGMGNIGAAIARRGRLGFNMPILYSGNSRKTELEKPIGRTISRTGPVAGRSGLRLPRRAIEREDPPSDRPA
nr:hypothetical protein GCM10020185_48690 [Pseudomonas brassicacearum subsp. brassicacearum]